MAFSPDANGGCKAGDSAADDEDVKLRRRRHFGCGKEGGFVGDVGETEVDEDT